MNNTAFGTGFGKPYRFDNDVMYNVLNNYFKPQCCPSVYSNEQGCACLTHEQIMHLSKRAGNATNTY